MSSNSESSDQSPPVSPIIGKRKRSTDVEYMVASSVEKKEIKAKEAAIKNEKEKSSSALPVKQPKRKKRKQNITEEELTEQQKLEAQKYERGEKLNLKKIKDRKIRGNVQKAQYLASRAAKEAVKAQVLLTEQAGYLEGEGMEETADFSQRDLVPHVDLQTSSKMFDLVLDQLGPYTIDYSPNGKHLLLCGRRGHVAMLDWTTKELVSELHLNETCKDVKFLHDHTFFAVAQKRFAYIYDSEGTEIHRLENMNTPAALEFLRYHFLLVSINEGGCLKYQDTSTGQLVANHYTKNGPCNVIRQNPWNSIINLGHSKGTVTMWSPSSKESLVTMQCHASSITSLAVDSTGKYMVTAGRDNKLKIWDVRTYKELYSYYTPCPATSVDISQRGVISFGCGSTVQMWKDCFVEEQSKPYMKHRIARQTAERLRFCPYEDFLGVGHSGGFSSVVVPGSGEPNFDSFAANPYQTAKQRKETEVQALLDKIQPEMIQLNPNRVGSLAPSAVTTPGSSNIYLQSKTETETEKNKKPKNKMRGKGTASKRANLKQHNVWDKNRELQKEQKEKQQKAPSVALKNVPKALSRFK